MRTTRQSPVALLFLFEAAGTFLLEDCGGLEGECMLKPGYVFTYPWAGSGKEPEPQ
jgi:hypothetical protein